MGFSPLADKSRRIPDVGRSNPRTGAISGFTVHHQAGVDVFGMATMPGYEVSAQYWITNDGVILPNIDENRRAWTTGAVGYPAGAESDYRNITVEVSNSPEGVAAGTWAISNAAMRALINLIADVFKRHSLGTVRRGKVGGVAVHQDFVPTACPGPYIMANLDYIISEAEKVRSGGNSSGGGGKPVTPPSSSGKSIGQLADEVYRGDWGNGQARIDRLRAAGYDPAAVQVEVDRKYYGGGLPPSGPSANISALADAVMRGEYGDGVERQQRLGANYQAVQNEINRRLYGGSTSGLSVNELADAVMRGDYGNGAERQQRLGVNFGPVQAEVNRRLGIG